MFSDGFSIDQNLIFSLVTTHDSSAANETFSSTPFNDTYIYERGDGHDTIVETGVLWGEQDKLLFMDIDPTELTLVRAGNDVTLVVSETIPGAGDGGSIKIEGGLQNHNEQGVEQIVFADGTIWTPEDLREKLLTSTSADEEFMGFAGSNTYRYSRGGGNDTIDETGVLWGNADKLLLLDINPNDVTLRFFGSDLWIMIAESSPGAGDHGSVQIKGTLGTPNQQGVEEVIFADGTSWSAADLRAYAISAAQSDGNDILFGFGTGDTYVGGRGDDIITGNGGNDTYVYSRGDGHDTLIEDYYYQGTDDKLVLVDVGVSDVILTRNGTDLTVVVGETSPNAGDNGSIVLKDNVNASYQNGVEKVQFVDGTVWTLADMLANIAYIGGTEGSDTVVGTAGSDLQIRAGLGNDILLGLEGSDTYIYGVGDGNDTIAEITSGTDVDTLSLIGLNLSDVRFERLSSSINDVVIRVFSNNAVIILKDQFNQAGGVERIVFSDGTIIGGDNWSLDGFFASNAVIYGTAGNDTVGGTSGNDIFVGGLGDDQFNTGSGSDTYIYAAGDGNDYINDDSGSTVEFDVLKLTDLNVDDLTFGRSGLHFKITVNSTGQVITLDEQLDASIYRHRTGG